MFSFKKSLIAICLISSSILFSEAKASILIEPHVAYGMLGVSDFTSNGNSAKLTFSGPQYGARLGYQSFGFMLGLDYTRSSNSNEIEILSQKYTNDTNRDQFGAFVGYNFPVLFRIWGGYYFSDKSTSKADNSLGHKDDYTSGSGTEVGLGFSGFPFLSINISYRMSSYNKQYSALTGATTDISPKLDTSEIALGVSLPLHL